MFLLALLYVPNFLTVNKDEQDHWIVIAFSITEQAIKPQRHMLL
jgi:hypothetical protein